LPLTYLEGNGTNKIITGDLSGSTTLIEICCTMDTSVLTGDAATITDNWRYLDIFTNNLYGDITSKTLMTRFRESGTGGSDFSGSIAGWSDICNFGLNSGHVTKLTRLNIATKMCYFRPPVNWQYGAAEMEDLLVDLWANRDVAFPAAYAERYFDFTQNPLNAEPTGLGLTSMYAILNYHSPSDNIAYAQWQIITNQAYGPEKVVDGIFSVPASWTFSTPPWLVSGGKASYDDTVYDALLGTLASAFVSGENYRITFDVSDLSAGTDAHTDWYDGSWNGIMDRHVQNNTKCYFYYACAANGTGLKIFGLLNSSGSFKIDNLSIKKIL
jgi:hypothetical protein